MILMHPLGIWDFGQSICNQFLLFSSSWQQDRRAAYLLHTITSANVVDVIG